MIKRATCGGKAEHCDPRRRRSCGNYMDSLTALSAECTPDHWIRKDRTTEQRKEESQMTIKELLADLGISIDDLANGIGADVSTLSDYANGNAEPSAEVLAAIKEAYGLDVGEPSACPAAELTAGETAGEAAAEEETGEEAAAGEAAAKEETAVEAVAEEAAAVEAAAKEETAGEVAAGEEAVEEESAVKAAAGEETTVEAATGEETAGEETVEGETTVEAVAEEESAVEAAAGEETAGEETTVEAAAEDEASRQETDADMAARIAAEVEAARIAAEEKAARKAAKKAAKKQKADEEAARWVAEAIQALSDCVDLSDEDAVVAARDAYDSLTDDQEQLIPGDLLSLLVAAEQMIEEASKTFPIEDCWITVKDVPYTGKKIEKPSVKVECGDRKLKEGEDYTFTYDKKARDVGLYTLTIEGKAHFTGSVDVPFYVVPKAKTLKKMLGGDKQASKIWKRLRNITGYQVEYSLEKDLTDSRKVKIKKPKDLEKLAGKLKAGKKYYVRARIYATIKKKKYFSDWSRVKALKL